MKNVFLLVVVFIGAIATAQTGWQKADSKNYNLSYPTDWTYIENEEGAVKFIVSSPKVNDKDEFTENVNLLVDKVEEGASLDNVADALKGQLKGIVGDFKLESSKKTEDGGLEIIYTGKMGDFKLKWKQWLYVVDNTTLVVFSFTAEQKNYNTYLPVAEQIIGSMAAEK